jgi:hypothetical protein
VCERFGGLGRAAHDLIVRALPGSPFAACLRFPALVGSRSLRVVRVDHGVVAEHVLLGGGAWIGYVNLVPVVIPLGEEPVIPQLQETITESAVSADAGRVMSPGFKEAVLP